MLQDHYLETDLQKVKDELRCFANCTQEALLSAQKGKMERANCYMDNALRSLSQLADYARNKQERDKLQSLLFMMEKEDLRRVYQAYER